MNVEIGAEAALFPEKEYIKGIFVAVRSSILTGEVWRDGVGEDGERAWSSLYHSILSAVHKQETKTFKMQTIQFRMLYDIHVLASFQTKENPFSHLHRCT
jgi:hypothetical protein